MPLLQANKSVFDSFDDNSSTHNVESDRTTVATSPISRLENKMWKVFTRRQREQEWVRGCSYFAEFEESGHSKHFCSASELPIIEVDFDKWNKYWEVYSVTFGSRLDELTAEFITQNNQTNEKVKKGNTSDEHMYRRVLVSVRYINENENNNGDSKLEPKDLEEVMRECECELRYVAHRMGAIEHCSMAKRIFTVQFTSSLAACTFLSWANKLPLYALNIFGKTSSHSCNNVTESSISIEVKEHLQEQEQEQQREEENLQTLCHRKEIFELELVARLAPRDFRVVSHVLQLGPRIRIPTAFVQSLFVNVFEAKEVVYMQRLDSFLIYFSDDVTAQVTLHAAQSSLYRCFGLDLMYYHDSTG